MSKREIPALYDICAPGIRCKLSGLGASIVSVEVPDRLGNFINIALSPRNFEDGSDEPALAGRTIGPCCGRVRDGLITIDGQQYRLEKNEGANHIHGGSTGCSQQIWQGEQLSPTHVRFQLTLPDGLSGYPGNRTVRADYTVTDNSLQVVYSAVTDRATWLCLTNHVYWDLSGQFDGSAMRQSLEIAADQAVCNDAQHLPRSIVPAKDNAFDFSIPDSPESKRSQYPEEEQLRIGQGFNNAFLLNQEMRNARGFCARLTSRHSDIRMTMQTNQPAIVLYTGGFLNEQTRLRNAAATPGCAIALEAQDIPDPFHLPGAEKTILRPTAKWQRYIRWSFDRITG